MIRETLLEDSRHTRRAFLTNSGLVLAAGLVGMTNPIFAQKAPPASAGPLDPNLVEDLVAANRILTQQGVLDAQGHVSVRHNRDPNRYVISRSLAPELVTPDDLMEYDLDSNPVNAAGRAQYIERFIHGEIYKVRPDVHAVVHNHSPGMAAFTLISIPLKPIHPGSGFIGAGLPSFDFADHREVGGVQMLVYNGDLGHALALALGNRPAVFMRAHGVAVVGPSLPFAVGRSIWLEWNASVQERAIDLGGTVRYLSPDEAQATVDAGENSGYQRPWELWKRKAMGK